MCVFSYSYEACFKGEIVFPVQVAKSSLKQEDCAINEKQLYLPTDPTVFFFFFFVLSSIDE